MEYECCALKYPAMVYAAASAEEAAWQYGIDCGIPLGVMIVVTSSSEIENRSFGRDSRESCGM